MMMHAAERYATAFGPAWQQATHGGFPRPSRQGLERSRRWADPTPGCAPAPARSWLATDRCRRLCRRSRVERRRASSGQSRSRHRGRCHRPTWRHPPEVSGTPSSDHHRATLCDAGVMTMDEIISFIDSLDGVLTQRARAGDGEPGDRLGRHLLLLRTRRCRASNDSTLRNHRDQELSRRRELAPRSSRGVPGQSGGRKGGVHRSRVGLPATPTPVSPPRLPPTRWMG